MLGPLISPKWFDSNEVRAHCSKWAELYSTQIQGRSSRWNWEKNNSVLNKINAWPEMYRKFCKNHKPQNKHRLQAVLGVNHVYQWPWAKGRYRNRPHPSNSQNATGDAPLHRGRSILRPFRIHRLHMKHIWGSSDHKNKHKLITPFLAIPSTLIKLDPLLSPLDS